MFAEVIQKSQVRRREDHIRLRLWLILWILALAIFVGTSHAQILGDLEADIPFQFHAGNTKFPAGKYRIHMLDNSDLGMMEISSADGSTSALLEVQSVTANSTPAQTELIFNKYGNTYFLAKLFDEGNSSGNQVVESSYEKRISRENKAAGQQHVSARRRGQR